jgi:GMP synthase (glutamine-hydrolysing)
MLKNIWIVDFGSQYTQLITRKFRELGHASLIITVEKAFELIQTGERPSAFVLSGGPQSVFEDQTDYSPIFNLQLPVLGICYGMQLIGQYFGGVVEKGLIGEYGHSQVHFKNDFKIQQVPSNFSVWMSHSDHVSQMPKGFQIILESANGLVAGIENLKQKIMALQFHPEVHHSQYGSEVLQFFLENVAQIKPNWDNQTIMQSCLEVVKQAQGKKVLCAFSGGVDSLVAAVMTAKLIQQDLYCFFVDNGLLRPQDHHHIETLKKNTKLNIEVIDAKDIFYKRLADLNDPELKRKAIGATFIEVFESKVHEFEKQRNIHFDYLLQGTLYPDVIESISPHGKSQGKSVTIKSHHNVGGLPERMKLKLLEPLRFLFKDEVRALGMELGLKRDWVYRHPFPGPGIGVRVLGEIKPDSVRKVQESDQILFEELHLAGLYNSTWQAFTVLLPVKTVGVKGDGRAYEEVISLRMVNSRDGMTATFTELPWEFLAKVSNRITNEVKGITRVVYDITSKPPGTIEWE